MIESTYKETLKKLNLKPSKRKGQNFLIDRSAAARILNGAVLEDSDIVVEIGPGLGILTFPLAEMVSKVIAIEKDSTLSAYLKEEAKKYHNIEIIEADAMNISYRRIFERFQKRLKVVSNLPYAISTPIIFKLLEERDCFDSFLLMLQKEVGERIASLPETKGYGALSVMVQLLANVSILATLPPNVFYPRPKVYSSLLYFRMLDNPRVEIKDIEAFRRLVNASFGQRRKTLKNALKSIFSEDSERLLKKVGIDPTRRGETLSIKEFKVLYDAWQGV